MSYQTLKITPDNGDEPYELKVTARDALVWERTAKKRPTSIMAYLTYPSIEEAYRLAHIVAKREQRFAGSLKEFEQTHDLSITSALDIEDEPDPTNEDPSNDE